MNISLKKKGFTLIELVVSIAIASIIFTLLSSLFSVGVKSLKNSNTKVQNINNTYLAMEYIRGEIERADYIVDNGNKSSLGFGIINYLGDNKDVLYKYTYYSFENNNLYRNTQKSNKNYFKLADVRGKFGKNMLVENIQNINCSVYKSYIGLEIQLDKSGFNEKYNKIYAIRTFK